MGEIRYKTEGNSSPKGKPRVWFCAHADDYDLYRNSVIKDMLSAHSCAVYYDEDPHGDWSEQELLAGLGEMNLFVMPVTMRLLNTKNRALDVEFAFATKHNIPVLPLMMDEGIERCGYAACCA